MGMALDEPKKDDHIVEQGSLKFMADPQTTDVLRQSGGLNIDFIDEAGRKGYMLQLGNAGSCGSEGSGGCEGCG
jgi:Fe-S cluster assembly iron-binding protein IscA